MHSPFLKKQTQTLSVNVALNPINTQKVNQEINSRRPDGRNKNVECISRGAITETIERSELRPNSTKTPVAVKTNVSSLFVLNRHLMQHI